MKKFILLTALIILSLQSSPTYSKEIKPNPQIGKHLYRSYCVLCHGNDGKSMGVLAKKLNLKPADLTKQKYSRLKIDALVKLISGYSRNGNSAMPVWKDALPASNLKHIASYILKLSDKSLRYKGDVRQGRYIFKSACVACHGKIGQGNGVLAKLIEIPMIDFTNAKIMNSEKESDILNVIRNGRGDYMPSWKNDLNEREITDVAAYIRSLGR